MNENKKAEEMSDHELLHTLWTNAVGTERYNKRHWQELERRFLVHETDSSPTHRREDGGNSGHHCLR